MADEAEKLINLSLCKIAESRGVRRGGTSLHKHLLISTVLTKARSAYFETWYMDGEASALGGDENSQPINLDNSYQEEDFPLDDDDDEDFDDDNVDSFTDQFSGGLNGAESNENVDPRNCASNSDNNNMIDPRFFVEVETEIELPPDILNCVENLGDLSERMNFSADESASSLSVSGDLERQTTRMALSELSSSPESNAHDLSPQTQLTYIDLDSKSQSDFEDNNNNQNANSEANLGLGSPLRCSTPNPSKRRRGWSLEEDEDEGEEGNLSVDSLLTSEQFTQELNEKLKRNGLSVTNVNVAKRLRFSPDSENSGLPSPGKSPDSAKPLPVIIDSKFRTKKSHFDEDAPEESDDDPFLGDGLGQGPFDGDSAEQLGNLSHRNDRRVPSGSSSGSSSDEDGEAEMDVDTITNLVQIISFGKHQSALLHVSPLNSVGTNSSPSAVGSASFGLVRSISSPDLCGLSSSSSSRVSVSSNSVNNAKDLFSFHVSKSNSSSQQMSHRVLTTA